MWHYGWLPAEQYKYKAGLSKLPLIHTYINCVRAALMANELQKPTIVGQLSNLSCINFLLTDYKFTSVLCAAIFMVSICCKDCDPIQQTKVRTGGSYVISMKRECTKSNECDEPYFNIHHAPHTGSMHKPSDPAELLYRQLHVNKKCPPVSDVYIQHTDKQTEGSVWDQHGLPLKKLIKQKGCLIHTCRITTPVKKMTLYISWYASYYNKSHTDELIDIHELPGVLFKTKFTKCLEELSPENYAAYFNNTFI